MEDREQFLRHLAILADLCEYVMSKEIAALYDQAFSENYSLAARAVEKIVYERSSRDKFPSIAEIRNVISPTLSPASESEITAAKIVLAIRRHGYTWINCPNWRQEAETELGLIGMRVVDLYGGWVVVCQENPNGLRTKLRDLAKSCVEERKVQKGEQLSLPKAAVGDLITLKSGELDPDEL